MQRLLRSYYGPILLIVLIASGVSFITRLSLLMVSLADLDHSVTAVGTTMLIGTFYDLVFSSYFIIPLVFHQWFISDRIYSKPMHFLVIGIYSGLVLLFYFSNLIPKEYDAKLKMAVAGLLLLRLVIFILLSYMGTAFRRTWRKYVLYADFMLLIFLLVFNAVSEYVFWNEFSARYNFIAVDYLIYTHEVIGNIRESYPLPLIISLVSVATLFIFFTVRKFIAAAASSKRPSFLKRSKMALALFLPAGFSILFVSSDMQKFSNNTYNNELAGNGLFDFGVAFVDNKLDFEKYYSTISDREAFRLLRDQLAEPGSKFTSDDVFNIEREITGPLPEKKYNIVLVSIESFSASFMHSFGNEQAITPFLDSLSEQSLFFTNCYATGTRTVRGLEALSVGIVPTPGQSVVKRRNEENGNLFSLASVLNKKGYHAEYIYGGYSYFDNMNSFFSRNGYEVVDRTSLNKNEIHYANIWGVADEDLFRLALKRMDKSYAEHKPFFSHVMTVSNHRPFTYPEGRIDIPPEVKSREGGVKYTDFAIRQFVETARSKPWFDNTIFVFVADHCASAAGKTDLPLKGYHIPLMIYAPALLAPKKINVVMSQIDIDPTILGLLNLSYKSKFFGHDVLRVPSVRQRAFISTYQVLGYLSDSTLISLSPRKQIRTSQVDLQTGTTRPATSPDSLINVATAWYQCANWLLNRKRYSE